MALGLLITEEMLEEKKERASLLFKRIGRGGAIDRSGQTGRGNGNGNKASFIRELISADAKEFGISKAAEAWGVGVTSAFCYRDGRRSVSQEKQSDEKIVKNSDKIVEERRNHIIESTTLKLMEVMDNLNVKGMNDPVKQSLVGKNLATIMEKVEEKKAVNSGLTFVIHVPTTKKVEDFGEAVRIIEAEVVDKK